MRSSYQPISCARHSEYELAILQRRPLRLQWHTNSGITESQKIFPTDLVTRPGGEFLIAINGKKQPIEIRLEQIIEEGATSQNTDQSNT